MDETLKWFSTLGVGGILAGGMFMLYRRQAKENLAAMMVQAREHQTALLDINRRLEHIIESSRQERQATQLALIDALSGNSAVIATHTQVMNDVRDWMRRDR